MTIKHALVCGEEIKQYMEGTVVRSTKGDKVEIRWQSPGGATYVVDSEEDFVCGSYNDLVGILRKKKESIQEKVQMVLNRSFFKPSDTEKCVVWLMVKDGVDLDTITPSRVSQLIHDMIGMMNECNSLEEAYMCCAR